MNAWYELNDVMDAIEDDGTMQRRMDRKIIGLSQTLKWPGIPFGEHIKYKDL